MQIRLRTSKGFTLVELLVVLVIVAILAAVAAPIYSANTERSKASEAVSAISSIRQALRDNKAAGGTYFNIASNNVQNALPTSVTAAGVPNPSTSGVTVDVGIPQYFSNAAFAVVAATSTTPAFDADGASSKFTNPAAQDFIITVTGSASVLCGSGGGAPVTTNCAIKQSDINKFQLEMDNTGRIFVTYDNTATTPVWSAY